MEKAKKRREMHLLITFTFIVFIYLLVIAVYQQKLSITGYVIGSNIEEDYNLYILNAVENEDITFVVPITAQNNIDKSSIQITVLDKDMTEVTKIDSDAGAINANDSKEVKLIWRGEKAEGQYQVIIFIYADDESYTYAKAFKVDKKTLTFESIVVNDFKLGEIVNFDIMIQNHLSQRLENVSAGILIYDNQNNIIEEVRSEKQSMLEGALARFKTTWDTKDILPGKYNAKLVIDYGNEFIEKDIVLNINSDTLEVYGIGYSISNPRGAKQNNNSRYTIIIFAVVLVALNIAWWIFYVHKRKPLIIQKA